MSFSIKNHCLDGASFIASPNFNQRPQGTVIDLIVIHNISLPPKQFGGPAIIDFFTNELDVPQDPYFNTIKELKVSAHLLVRRTGEVIQFVGFDQRAWHAGQSFYQRREDCNDFSIGIELEGSDDIPYEMIQYEVLSQICQVLIQHYPAISSDRIVGHSDIAPVRKTDPGPAFDWQLLKQLLDEKN